MTDKSDTADRPDVEAIIGKIRSHVRRAEEDLPGDDLTALESERDLKANLGALNETWEVGTLKGTGPFTLVRRPVYKVLGALIGEINNFNSNVARVLNRIVKLLDGSDTEASGEVLTNARRRLTLLTQLSERLEGYDDLQIDTRLKKIEKALAGLDESAGKGGASGE